MPGIVLLTSHRWFAVAAIVSARRFCYLLVWRDDRGGLGRNHVNLIVVIAPKAPRT